MCKYMYYLLVGLRILKSKWNPKRKKSMIKTKIIRKICIQITIEIIICIIHIKR